MANPEHLKILESGVAEWNRWREETPAIKPDLSGESLSRKDLSQANLSRCSLAGSHFNKSNLESANLTRANLSGASLQGTRFAHAKLVQATLGGVNATAADFTETDASYSDFTGAHLAEAILDRADLTGADLSRASLFEARLRNANLKASKLHWANLTRADLSGANLKGCDLTGVSIIETDLSGANLQGANLRYARLIDSTISGANLTDCRVYGIAVWNLESAQAQQDDLVITPADEAVITVDSLELAQFVYMLLNSDKLRQTIMTITSKVVLILGRFTEERMAILQGLREALRTRGYLPLLFDFTVPPGRDLTETVSTLAHLARFIIADITDARSIPQELMAIVPNLPSVPVQPILLSSQHEYGMFEHFKRYPWVLNTVLYPDAETLLGFLGPKVIGPAEALLNL